MAIHVREKASNHTMSEAARLAIAASRTYTDLILSLTGDEASPTKTFTISGKAKDQIGLDDHGMLSLYDDGIDDNGVDTGIKRVLLAKVTEDKAAFFKGKTDKAKGVKIAKGKTFTSENLIADLQELGVVPTELKKGDKFKFDLTKVDGIKDFPDVYTVTLEAADSGKEEEGATQEPEATPTKSKKAVEEPANAFD